MSSFLFTSLFCHTHIYKDIKKRSPASTVSPIYKEGRAQKRKPSLFYCTHFCFFRPCIKTRHEIYKKENPRSKTGGGYKKKNEKEKTL